MVFMSYITSACFLRNQSCGQMSDIMGRISNILKQSFCILCSARHDGLFDTLYSLVVLLKSGEWETYRQLFIGAMFLVEGICEEATYAPISPV